MAGCDYLTHFRFKRPPFSISPDPDFFFPSRAHIGALESLKYGIERGDGFLVLMGHAGTGKSLLLRLLLKQLGDGVQTAVVVTPMIDPVGLMEMLLEDLAGSVPEQARGSLSRLLKEFRDRVIGLAGRKKRLLVVIDEAQNLSSETLEQLRLLSNIELSDRKLVQILLSGQEGLKEILSRKGLGQLCQRITVSEVLEPLGQEEALDYIRYRMARAGRADIEIDPSAARYIHRQTCGVPRLINRLMDRALLSAAAQGKGFIDLEALKAAEETMEILNWQKRGGFLSRGPICPAIKRYAPAAVGAALIFSVFSFNLFPKDVSGLRATSESKAVFDPSSLGIKGNGAQDAVGGQGSGQKEMAGVLAHTAGPGTVEVRVSRALVRTKPARKFPQITSVKRGDRLMILDERRGWYRVQVYDALGKKTWGWIRKDMVKPAATREASPS